MPSQKKVIVSSNVSQLKDILENTVNLLGKLEIEFEKINNFEISVKIDKVGQSDSVLAPQ